MLYLFYQSEIKQPQPMLADKITEIFVKADDFCNVFKNEFSDQQLRISCNQEKRNRKAGLCDSETITILIAFHSGQFRNFKHFYVHYVSVHLQADFPGISFLQSFHRIEPSQCDYFHALYTVLLHGEMHRN